MSDEGARKDQRQASTLERFFLLQPVFGILLVFLMGIGGVGAYSMLVKESLPDLEIPQATVTAQWPGADPQTIEQEVTEPLEKEIKTIKGLKSVSSASFDSFSIIAVEFVAEADLDQSMQLLRTKVDDAAGELPAEVDAPDINQVSVDDRPILSVVLFGNVDDALLGQTANDLQDRLERVAGVNEVEVGGARDEIIRVDLYPSRLQALGITPVAVRDQIRGANIDMPWGEIEGEQFGGTTRLFGRFRDVDDLRQLPISRQAGRVVRLGEVADVRRDLEKETARAFFSSNGSDYRRSVELSIKKVPGSDTLEVVRVIEAELERARESTDWPYSVDYHITQDQSEQIQKSLSDVLMNGVQATFFVFVVLFVVLTWREGLIAGLSVPLCFLGALVVIWALGYTLNELVIIGMVLALGLLVDVFILMMEGMHEGIYVEKEGFEYSALSTFRRYALPAAAGQMTTILALAPLMAISGVAGKFIRVLPITAIACLVVAFLIAILVDIPLSRFLIKRSDKAENKELMADRVTARLSEQLRKWNLNHTLKTRRRALVWVAGAFAVFFATLLAFTTVPIIMYPPSDGLKLGITIELPPSTTLDSSQGVADAAGEILRSKPYLESVVKLVGKKSPMAQSSLGDALKPSEGDYLVGFSAMFVPRENRDDPGYEYADQLRSELRDLLDSRYAAASLVVVPETGSPNTEDPIQIEIIGDDMGLLRELSREVQSELSRIAGTTDVRDNLGSIRTEIKLLPRREALDFYGLSEQEVGTQVAYAMSHSEIGQFATSGLEDDLAIRLGSAWPSQDGQEGGPTRLDELAMVRVFDKDGNTIPILSVMEPRLDSAPIAITHKDARRSIIVMAKTADRPAGEIVADMRPILADMESDWPAGYSYAFAGEAQEAAETFGSAGVMLVLAIALVFALLVLIFGSFLQSFIVILLMPLAMIGVFGGFALFGIPFSFFAMVGVIALIGIVVNDAIVMVDTMNTHLRQGIGVDTAAARGASDRLRPIISTSVTTIIGLIPLAISNPMWRPLCYAIIFGLMAATVISLVVVPCLYYLLTRGDAFDSPNPT